MIPIIAAFLVSIDPCAEIRIPDKLIKYQEKTDHRSFLIRLFSSIHIKDFSLIPPKIEIKGGTDF